MRFYLRSNNWLRILLFVCFSSLVVTALTGFQDFKRDGVACRFQARIVDIHIPSPGTQILVVKELAAATATTKNKEQTIEVLVTAETISRSGDKSLKFSYFRAGMLLEIEGLKIIERENGVDYPVVQALRISQLVG